MDKRHAERILAEAAKRLERRTNLDPDEILFGPQREFVLDKSKNKAAVCSRRAGKSYGVAFMLLTEAFKHERSICPYITMTRDNAKLILWPALSELNSRYNLNLRFRENTGDVVLPNGSLIILRGADDQRQIEKLRGPKYPIAIIDEAQAFPGFLKDLIIEVLEPATLDYQGQIVLTGTPNAACAGPFYDFTNEEKSEWSVHRWTLRDNPHLPDVEGFLKKVIRLNNWDDNNPTFQREYCGKWVRDYDNLVFKINFRRNVCPTFPRDDADDWEYILGIDLGFNDPTAFVTLASSATLGRCYVVESYKESELIPSAVAARVETLMRRYPYTRVVADTGGFGKGYAEEMKRKFSIPVVPANKTEKTGYIEMMNGDFRSAALQICADRNKELLDEITLLQWDENKLGRNMYIFDRAFQDHLCDAMLYGWREATHHLTDWVKEGPRYGTTAYWHEEARKMEQAEIDAMESEDEPWWLKM